MMFKFYKLILIHNILKVLLIKLHICSEIEVVTNRLKLDHCQIILGISKLFSGLIIMFSNLPN